MRKHSNAARVSELLARFYKGEAEFQIRLVLITHSVNKHKLFFFFLPSVKTNFKTFKNVLV